MINDDGRRLPVCTSVVHRRDVREIIMIIILLCLPLRHEFVYCLRYYNVIDRTCIIISYVWCVVVGVCNILQCTCGQLGFDRSVFFFVNLSLSFPNK